MAKLPTGALVVEEAKNGSGYYFAAKWRHEGRAYKLRLGRAWIEARPAPLEGAEGWQRRYRRRRGEPRLGFLLPDDAIEAKRKLIRSHAERQAQAEKTRATVTFAQAAHEWMAERSAVAAWKATTLRNYAAALAQEDATPKRRGHAPRARVMSVFGGRPVESITGQDVARFLRTLDADEDLSARSVNFYRGTLSLVFGYAVEQGWRADNPVSATKKRRESDPAEIITYTPEQVMAIARACATEAHSALVVTAAFSGLRQGELLELRWRDVDFTGQKILVQRSFSAGLGVTSTKGRRGRVVPLADQAAQALARLSQRGFLVGRNDLVFPGPESGLRGGRQHDPGTVRAVYVAARDEAAKQDRDLPKLRFHDLRHTFGSLCAAGGVDLVTLQAWLGHRDSRTTSRYLHARSRADDAERLTRAFGGVEVPEAVAA